MTELERQRRRAIAARTLAKFALLRERVDLNHVHTINAQLIRERLPYFKSPNAVVAALLAGVAPNTRGERDIVVGATVLRAHPAEYSTGILWSRLWVAPPPPDEDAADRIAELAAEVDDLRERVGVLAGQVRHQSEMLDRMRPPKPPPSPWHRVARRVERLARRAVAP